jgi:hypothetical protein
MENQSQSIQLTEGEFNRLAAGLCGFLEENYDGACLDDDEDRSRVAEGVIGWLLSDKIRVVSPDMLLPKAKYHLSFNVVDELTETHIVRLTLDRTDEMSDVDFLTLQNFFWTTIGRAVRDNPDIKAALESGGIRVETDPEDSGGQQAAL